MYTSVHIHIIDDPENHRVPVAGFPVARFPVARFQRNLILQAIRYALVMTLFDEKRKTVLILLSEWLSLIYIGLIVNLYNSSCEVLKSRIVVSPIS